MECTGIFTARDKAAVHLEAGAKRVIVSAPSDGADYTIVLGVNHEGLSRDHKDIYRARAAGLNMIPTSTGAAKALGLVIPELKGKLDGISMRVPTPNVSVVDLKFVAKRATTKDEINAAIKAAADGPMQHVLSYTDVANVSSDFN